MFARSKALLESRVAKAETWEEFITALNKKNVV